MIEKTLAGIGVAECVKNPEQPSGGPAIASCPEFRVLRRTKFDVLPQFSRGILEVLAVQSALVVRELEEPVLRTVLFDGTEIGNKWGNHVHEVGPVAQ